MRLLLLTAALAVAGHAFGSALPNSYLGYAVQISVSESGRPSEPIGSGFILQASNSVYLVTARHVLFTNATDSWRLSHPLVEIEAFRALSFTNEETVLFDLNLDTLDRQGNARYATNRDIALVRFESCNPTNKALADTLPGAVRAKSPNLSLTPWMEDLLVTNLGASSVGEDVFLFGFPASIGVRWNPQVDPRRPLLRKGIIAGFNPTRNTIILDSPVYQGNSGGPVVIREAPQLGVTTFRLIGIVVEWIPFEDVWESKRFKYTNSTMSNSGYSVVERCETFLNLVWE